MTHSTGPRPLNEGVRQAIIESAQEAHALGLGHGLDSSISDRLSPATVAALDRGVEDDVTSTADRLLLVADRVHSVLFEPSPDSLRKRLGERVSSLRTAVQLVRSERVSSNNGSWSELDLDDDSGRQLPVGIKASSFGHLDPPASVDEGFYGSEEDFGGPDG